MNRPGEYGIRIGRSIGQVVASAAVWLLIWPTLMTAWGVWNREATELSAVALNWLFYFVAWAAVSSFIFWLGARSTLGDEIFVCRDEILARAWRDALRRRPWRRIALDVEIPIVWTSVAVWVGDDPVKPSGPGAANTLLAILRQRGFTIVDQRSAPTGSRAGSPRSRRP